MTFFYTIKPLEGDPNSDFVLLIHDFVMREWVPFLKGSQEQLADWLESHAADRLTYCPPEIIAKVQPLL